MPDGEKIVTVSREETETNSWPASSLDLRLRLRLTTNSFLSLLISRTHRAPDSELFYVQCIFIALLREYTEVMNLHITWKQGMYKLSNVKCIKVHCCVEKEFELLQFCWPDFAPLRSNICRAEVRWVILMSNTPFVNICTGALFFSDC